MTVFGRAALCAAMTLVLAVAGTSTPGWAMQAETPQTTGSSIVWGGNAPVVQAVPADSAAAASDGDFDTLDQAVSAQTAETADQALRCLAGAVYHEAKGEPLMGQLAVAEVILNRAKSGRFPGDLCAVVTQRGQFGFVRGGRIPAVNPAATAWRVAVAVAKVALADVWDSPAQQALYFNAAGRAPGRAIRVAAIGNHVFYR